MGSRNSLLKASTEVDGINSELFNIKYEVKGIIGSGTFSHVFECKNYRTGQFFACKKLKTTYKCWENCIDIHFHAKYLRKHPNPHVLHLYESYFDPRTGQILLIYDFMDADLLSIIKNSLHDNEPLPDARVCSFMFQIFTGLAHLHKNQIFHSDLKPENILVKLPEYIIKLGDFGNAQPIDDILPKPNIYIATRPYRAPECILTNGYYGHKIDIWSVGCIFYELMARKILFLGENELNQIQKIVFIIGLPPFDVFQKFCSLADDDRKNHDSKPSNLRRLENIEKILTDMKIRYDSSLTEEHSDSEETETPQANLNAWNHIMPVGITDEAETLLRQLLQYDENLRPSANGALCYSYFDQLK